MKGKLKKFGRKTKESFTVFNGNPRAVLQRYQLAIHIGETGSVYTGCYANDPRSIDGHPVGDGGA